MAALYYWQGFELCECFLVISVVLFAAVAELRPFPRDAARRKDTVMVGNAARLDCPYPHQSAAETETARIRYHWSKVTSEHDRRPVRIISDNRLVVGVDGELNAVVNSEISVIKFKASLVNHGT